MIAVTYFWVTFVYMNLLSEETVKINNWLVQEWRYSIHLHTVYCSSVRTRNLFICSFINLVRGNIKTIICMGSWFKGQTSFQFRNENRSCKRLPAELGCCFEEGVFESVQLIISPQGRRKRQTGMLREKKRQQGRPSENGTQTVHKHRLASINYAQREPSNNFKRDVAIWAELHTAD